MFWQTSSSPADWGQVGDFFDKHVSNGGLASAVRSHSGHRRTFIASCHFAAASRLAPETSETAGINGERSNSMSCRPTLGRGFHDQHDVRHR